VLLGEHPRPALAPQPQIRHWGRPAREGGTPKLVNFGTARPPFRTDWDRSSPKWLARRRGRENQLPQRTNRTAPRRWAGAGGRLKSSSVTAAASPSPAESIPTQRIEHRSYTTPPPLAVETTRNSPRKQRKRGRRPTAGCWIFRR
jgi:hypothetical protein